MWVSDQIPMLDQPPFVAPRPSRFFSLTLLLRKLPFAIPLKMKYLVMSFTSLACAILSRDSKFSFSRFGKQSEEIRGEKYELESTA